MLVDIQLFTECGRSPVHVLVDIQLFTECGRSPVHVLVDIQLFTDIYVEDPLFMCWWIYSCLQISMWKIPCSCVGGYTAVYRYLCGRSPVHVLVDIQLFTDIYVEGPLFMCWWIYSCLQISMWKVPCSCVGGYTAVYRYLCGRSPVHVLVDIQLFTECGRSPVHVLVDIQLFTECGRSPVHVLVDIITAVYRYLCGRSPVHVLVDIQLFTECGRSPVHVLVDIQLFTECGRSPVHVLVDIQLFTECGRSPVHVLVDIQLFTDIYVEDPLFMYWWI